MCPAFPRKVVATGFHESHLRSRAPPTVRSLKKWVGVKFPLNESQPKMMAFVHPSVQSANRIGYDKRNISDFQTSNVV